MAFRLAAVFSCLLAPAVSGKQFRSTAPGEKVRVEFYGEAGCPNCQDFVAGGLRETLHAPGVAPLLDLEVFPWGNAYFATQKCGGVGEYSVQIRHCYDNVCGRDAKERPSDCFQGKPICQHGEPECIANRYLACAKNTTGGHSAVLVPFLDCMEAGYLQEGSEGQYRAVAEQCATLAAMPFEPVRSCYESKLGDELIVLQASLTPDHPGVPFVVVNGKPMEPETESRLLQAVCSAISGDKPAGCRNLTATSL